EVTGIEGQRGPVSGADDIAANAHYLGELDPHRLVQVSGSIGDDPSLDPNLSLNQAADVDMYHFRITGTGNYSFAAEVFAGRIGSPLDPGVSLFRLNPGTGLLEFVDGNNNTRNPEQTANGFVPLYTDAALFTGLTAGEYYVAVSSGQNTPTPVE